MTMLKNRHEDAAIYNGTGPLRDRYRKEGERNGEM